MRPFILDEKKRQELLAMVAYAEANPILVNTGNIDQVAVAGDNPKLTCRIDLGYRVVFSIEQQKIGPCRHLSVSVAEGEPGALPNPHVVFELMKLIGFDAVSLDKVKGSIWEEHGAINVIEIIWEPQLKKDAFSDN